MEQDFEEFQEDRIQIGLGQWRNRQEKKKTHPKIAEVSTVLSVRAPKELESYRQMQRAVLLKVFVQ